MRMSCVSLGQQGSAMVISLLVLLAGLVSLPGLQVENLPPIAPGRVSVSASYPGAGPEVTAGGIFADVLRLATYLGAAL